MVIKGGSVAGARRLAAHLLRHDTNETVRVVELRGVLATDLASALAEMETVASGSRTSKPFYHAALNSRSNERLNPTQRRLAIDQLEVALGLTGQPRVVIAHQKLGRAHTHVVWSRVELRRMVAISDSHNYRKHEQVSRHLERSFGHARVQGAHVERDDAPRPPRTPSHAEMQTAARSGINPRTMKERVTTLWHTTDTAAAFVASLADAGLTLARGDKRDLVLIDVAGETHSLARRIEGVTAKQVRERMATIDMATLPGVTKARARQRERQQIPSVPDGLPAAPEIRAAEPVTSPEEIAPVVQLAQVAAELVGIVRKIKPDNEAPELVRER